MKLKNILLILLAMVIVVSCNKEPLETPSADFKVYRINPDNEDELIETTTVFAGEEVVIKVNGSGDFLTFYPGDKSREYDSIPFSEGVIINTEIKTTRIVYAAQDTVKAVLIASSYGNWAEDSEVDIVEKTLYIVDSRASITSMLFGEGPLQDATVSINQTERIINISVLEVADKTQAKPIINLASKGAKVFVDGTEFKSATTVVDLTKDDLSFKVVAPDGTEKTYTINIIDIPANDEAYLEEYEYGGTAAIGVINGTEITFLLPWGINFANEVNRKRPVFTAAPGASVYLMDGDDRYGPLNPIGSRNIPITTPDNDKIIVIAENLKDSIVYTLKIEEAEPFSSFSLVGNYNPMPQALINDPVSAADTGLIAIDVASGTDITNIVSQWEGVAEGVVYIGSTVQVNGVTANDFTMPKLYELRGSSDTLYYEVVIE